MSQRGGLLIVNADDWGYDDHTTSAIADCFEAGGLTSTTAMTFMRGSESAARRAAELPELGIGLHLNLVEEYSDPSTPAAVRERQRRFVEYFRLHRLRRWVYDPRVRAEVNQVIADQMQCFVDLYGRPPTHVDGHHHCHLALNVLLSPALPAGTKVRNALSDAHRRNPVTDALRCVRDRALRGRHPTTDYFLSIDTVWPDLRREPSTAKLSLSRAASVEVMVHPAFEHEYLPLQSEPWVAALGDLPTGSYASL